jgi:uncharacterized protein (DUF2147 family)
MVGLDRRLVPVLLAAVVTSTATVEGLWRTPSRGGLVELSPCGPALCGRLVGSDAMETNPDLKDINNRDADLRTRRLKGLLMLQGFTGGPTQWRGGTVYNPEDGGTYKGSITLVDPDHLKLTGCIVRPLCKSQTWIRAR